MANATGADQVPAVREALGRMSSYEAMIAGMVNGQINAFERLAGRRLCLLQPPHDVRGARMVHAELQQVRRRTARTVRRRRVPDAGEISVMRDRDLARDFQTYWQTPQSDAVTRMKLFKLAWDMVGSEFAGRHQQYEKFYAGASFIVRNHAFRETDWAAFNKIVEDLMAGYDHNGGIAKIAAE